MDNIQFTSCFLKFSYDYTVNKLSKEFKNSRALLLRNVERVLEFIEKVPKNIIEILTCKPPKNTDSDLKSRGLQKNFLLCRRGSY
jgi:hypothetical protein